MSQERIMRSFSSFHNLNSNLQLPCKPLILYPPKPPCSMPLFYSISYHLSFPCSCNDPPSLCNAATVYPPSHSDITGWTDGSVPGELGEGGVGIKIKCTKCLIAPSLLLDWILGHQL